MELIDTHCHLYSPPLSDDPVGVIARARARGVSRVIVPAYDRASWDATGELARLPGVSGALGLHPWAAGEPFEPEALRRALVDLGAVAVGEIGLDAKEGPPLDRQMEVLRAQCEVARSLDLPVILHCRGRFEELLALLDELAGDRAPSLPEAPSPPATPGSPEASSPADAPGVRPRPEAPRSPLRGVVHAFSRGPDLARGFLDRGLHLAFGGAVTRAGSRAVRSAPIVPAERLLLETDAPSIGLEGVPAERTEPAHVRDVAAALARLRGETVDELARRTTANAMELFRL